MYDLTFVLMAHEPHLHVAELLRTLMASEPTINVVVHYDGKIVRKHFEVLRDGFSSQPRVHFVEDRAKCEWGGFGLVDGVARALKLIVDKNIPGDHIYLISGSCMPVRSVAELKLFLHNHPTTEFVECYGEEWIKAGLHAERYRYRHWFNLQTRPTLFGASWRLQRRLGLARQFPKPLVPRFGSQWWCLTRRTCAAIVEWISAHPRDYRFFRTTWIPDELFFQSMVWALAPRAEIQKRSLTYFNFTATGRPVTFFDNARDDALPGFPYFFMRKVAYGAAKIRARLAERAAAAPDEKLIAAYARRLPSLDAGAPRLPPVPKIETEWRTASPGQIFYRDQIYVGWPAALGKVSKPFVVLYGPSVFTEVAAKHFTPEAGYCVLGRLFARNEVDFGPDRPRFGGLSRQDAEMRDMDPPLYVARVLDRANGIPVFRINPGDAPKAEGGLWYFRDGALVLPCMPYRFCMPGLEEDSLFTRDYLAGVARRLFWALAAAELGEAEQLAHLELASYGRQRTEIERFIDDVIAKAIPHAHVAWMTNELRAIGVVETAADDDADILAPVKISGRHALFWGEPGVSGFDEKIERVRDHELALRLRTVFGPHASAVAQTIAQAQAALSGLPFETVGGALPDLWREYFRVDFRCDEQRGAR